MRRWRRFIAALVVTTDRRALVVEELDEHVLRWVR